MCVHTERETEREIERQREKEREIIINNNNNNNNNINNNNNNLFIQRITNIMLNALYKNFTYNYFVPLVHTFTLRKREI